jgi:hypothetical protein
MADSNKIIYTGRTNQSSNFDKVAGSGQEDLKKSNYNVGESIDNGANSENLNHDTGEPTVNDRADLENLNHNNGEATVKSEANLSNANHNNGEATVKDEANLGNDNHNNGEATVNYTAMASAPQPYQHQFCTSCGAVDHRFARCPNAPVNDEGYVEGCGCCNALDHAVTECTAKKLRPRELYYFLVTCRDRLPPMVASKDPREICPARWAESPHRPMPPSVALARRNNHVTSAVSDFDISRWDQRNRWGNYILDRQIHSRYRTQAGPEQVRIPNPTESNEPKAEASSQGGPSAKGDDRDRGRGRGRGSDRGRGRGNGPSATEQWVENNRKYQRGGSVAGRSLGGNENFRGHNNYRGRGRGRGSGHYDDYRRPAPVPLEDQDSNLAENLLGRLTNALAPEYMVDLAMRMYDRNFESKFRIEKGGSSYPSGPYWTTRWSWMG